MSFSGDRSTDSAQASVWAPGAVAPAQERKRRRYRCAFKRGVRSVTVGAPGLNAVLSPPCTSPLVSSQYDMFQNQIQIEVSNLAAELQLLRDEVTKCKMDTAQSLGEVRHLSNVLKQELQNTTTQVFQKCSAEVATRLRSFEDDVVAKIRGALDITVAERVGSLNVDALASTVRKHEELFGTIVHSLSFLRPVSDEYTTDDQVTLSGLSQAALNGKLAFIHESTHRHAERVPVNVGDRSVKVKPINLRPHSIYSRVACLEQRFIHIMEWAEDQGATLSELGVDG